MALEKLSPVAHKYIAAANVAGNSATDIRLYMDEEKLNKEIDALKVKEAKLVGICA